MHTLHLTALLLMVLSHSHRSHASHTQSNEGFYIAVTKKKKVTMYIQESTPMFSIRDHLTKHGLGYQIQLTKVVKSDPEQNIKHYMFTIPPRPYEGEAKTFKGFLQHNVHFSTQFTSYLERSERVSPLKKVKYLTIEDFNGYYVNPNTPSAEGYCSVAFPPVEVATVIGDINKLLNIKSLQRSGHVFTKDPTSGRIEVIKVTSQAQIKGLQATLSPQPTKHTQASHSDDMPLLPPPYDTGMGSTSSNTSSLQKEDPPASNRLLWYMVCSVICVVSLDTLDKYTYPSSPDQEGDKKRKLKKKRKKKQKKIRSKTPTQDRNVMPRWDVYPPHFGTQGFAMGHVDARK